MALSVNPLTSVIFVPKADLTLLQSSPEVRELNLNAFRLELRDWEDGEGITMLKTHDHNTEVTLSGLVYARIVEVLAPYTVEFEDGQYTINCVGANHNLSDVKVANQVSLIVNNAAGLINNAAIEYSSFDGAITVDLTSDYNGTTYPVGTPRRPVNNFQDALLIASTRGFTKLFIIGDATIDSGLDYSSLIIIGESITKTSLTISPEANVLNSEFEQATISGTLDGGAKITDCRIGNLDYVDGFIESCVLEGPVSLGGTETAHFLNCWSGVPGVSTPVVDMGGSGSALAFRNYNGGIKLLNKTGPESVSLDMNSGQVILDSTVNSGTLAIRGIAKLTDNSTGAANIVTDALLNTNQISEAVWDEPVVSHATSGTAGEVLQYSVYQGKVWVDSISGSAGTTYPLGTPFSPVNNMTDARTIAETLGTSDYQLHGTGTLDADFVDSRIFGESISNDVLDINGFDISRSTFNNMQVSGTMSGSAVFRDCMLKNVDDFAGTMVAGFVLNRLSLGPPSSLATFKDVAASNSPVIDVVGDGRILGAAGMQGDWTISNMSGAFPGSICRWSMQGGKVTLSSSCVGGILTIDGVSDIDNNSVGTTVVDTTLNRGYMSSSAWIAQSASYAADGTTGLALLSASAGSGGGITAGEVWDVVIPPAHTGSNTAGEFLFGAGGGSSPSAIADAVWNTAVVGHTGSNTFGELVAKRLLKFSLWLALK